MLRRRSRGVEARLAVIITAFYSWLAVTRARAATERAAIPMHATRIIRGIHVGRHMHRIVPVVLVVCLTACGVRNAPAGRATDVDAVTRAKVETWRRLYQQQDADGLRRFLADDFIVIDDEGTVSTKDAEVAWLAKNAWSGPADFRYVIDRISFPASDVALVVGHGFGTRIAEGKEPCIETYRSSNVFQRIEGTWKPAMSHISGAGCVSRADYDALYDRKQ